MIELDVTAMLQDVSSGIAPAAFFGFRLEQDGNDVSRLATLGRDAEREPPAGPRGDVVDASRRAGQSGAGGSSRRLPLEADPRMGVSRPRRRLGSGELASANLDELRLHDAGVRHREGREYRSTLGPGGHGVRRPRGRRRPLLARSRLGLYRPRLGMVGRRLVHEEDARDARDHVAERRDRRRPLAS